MFMPVVSEMSIALTSAARGGVKENRGPSTNEPTGEDIRTGAAYGEGIPSKAPAAALVEMTSWLLFAVTPTVGM